MQRGPVIVVSLMSTEAAQELKRQPGSVAVAVVKAITVIVETAEPGEALASDLIEVIVSRRPGSRRCQ